MPVTVTPVGASRSFTGTVWQVSPIIDPTTRQGVARVQLAYSPDLRPGGFATAIFSAQHVQAPVLPESAVLSDAQGKMGDLKPPKTATALQLVAEYDHTFFDYTAPSESGPSKFAGKYGLNTVTVGLNYWMTRHIRLTGDFVHNTFLGNSVTPLPGRAGSNEFTLRAALAI